MLFLSFTINHCCIPDPVCPGIIRYSERRSLPGLIHDLGIAQPHIGIVLKAAGLQPGISGKMTDHPAGVHKIAGSCRLGMKPAAGNRGEAVVNTLEDVVADEAGAKAFRAVKFEVVELRLGMSVRQISGPVAAVVHDFTQDHIGIRIDVDVNNGIDLTIGGIAEFALGAGILPGSILGTIQFRCKALVVMCALNKDFGILHCGHFDLYTAGNMQCPGAFCKRRSHGKRSSRHPAI